MLPDIRNYILKGTLLLTRIISPIMIFFFDTSLLFAWILSLLSVMLGYWLKLGKVSHMSLYVIDICSQFLVERRAAQFLVERRAGHTYNAYAMYTCRRHSSFAQSCSLILEDSAMTGSINNSSLELQVSSWEHVIDTFAESCSLHHHALMPDVEPDKAPFFHHNLEVRNTTYHVGIFQ